jgi:hypothetical protein
VADPIYQHGPTGRHAALNQQVEQARQAACLFEELIAWRTPGWQRNPVNAAVEIHRRGYAVYDGPTQPSTGSTDPQ